MPRPYEWGRDQPITEPTAAAVRPYTTEEIRTAPPPPEPAFVTQEELARAVREGGLYGGEDNTPSEGTIVDPDIMTGESNPRVWISGADGGIIVFLASGNTYDPRNNTGGTFVVLIDEDGIRIQGNIVTPPLRFVDVVRAGSEFSLNATVGSAATIGTIRATAPTAAPSPLGQIDIIGGGGANLMIARLVGGAPTAAGSEFTIQRGGDFPSPTILFRLFGDETPAAGDTLQWDGVNNKCIWSAGGGMRTLPIIGTDSLLSIGQQMAAANVAAFASGTWPVANRAIAVPFVLNESVTVVKLWCFNGAGVSGNVDVSIYNGAGTRQVSAGSTAQAGVNALQEFDVTDTALAAGGYYMVMALDNVTGTNLRWTHPFSIEGLQSWGLAQQGAAFPLPATLEGVAVATNYIPNMGFALRTLVT